MAKLILNSICGGDEQRFILYIYPPNQNPVQYVKKMKQRSLRLQMEAL